MRLMLVVIACLSCTPAMASELDGMNRSEWCALWGNNAAHGARQFLRGAARELAYVSQGTLIEMVEHFGGVAKDRIYVLDDAGYSAEDRRFLEQSTLYGYDALSAWTARQGGKEPQLSEWLDKFVNACMNDEALSAAHLPDKPPA